MCLSGLIALIPIILMLNILETTSTDSISNDYLRFTRLADRVQSEGYDWRFYMKDSLDNNAHSYAFLFLVRLALAKLTNLSIMAELYVGIAVAIVNLILIFSCLTRFRGTASPWRFLILPVLSAFVFSYSQISTYSYGEAVLQREFNHLGILIGLWMILLRSKSSLTPWAIFAGGILASYSGAGGLLAWPVFLFAIVVTKSGNLKRYFAWLAGLGISLMPYLAFVKINPANNAANLYVINRMITGLGLPLANNIGYGVLEHPQALSVGLTGIGLLVLAATLLMIRGSKHRFFMVIPSLVLVFWGIAGSGEIGLLRSALAPWYTSEYMVFWLGLLGLFFGFVWPDPTPSKQKFILFEWDKTFRVVGISGLIVLAFLFLSSNRTLTDKIFYLPSRSPTSAACLRNYATAPTYCEGFVFQWGVGNPTYLSEMGGILDKYHWSVLGPHQEWILQGDTILGKVSLESPDGSDFIRWAFPGTDELSHWSDYHRLNILLLRGQSLLWQIDLPQKLSRARLNLGLSLLDPTTCQYEGVSIQLESSLEASTSIFQQRGLCEFTHEAPVNENLLDYAGKRLVVRITNESGPGGGAAIRLHYPRVLVDAVLNERPDQFVMPEVRPLNSDLSPIFAAIAVPKEDVKFLYAVQKEHPDLQLQNSDGLMMRIGPAPSVNFALSEPACLANWSQLKFSLAMTDAVRRKMVRLRLQIRYDPETTREIFSYFPLLAGEDLHAYTLDLEILNLPPSACITDISFIPFDGMNLAPDQWMQVKDVEYLPRTARRFGFYP